MNSAYQFENEPNVSTRKELEDQFKQITGLDKEYLKGLTAEEIIQLYQFLTQTSAGQKFCQIALAKDKRLQNSNRRLGREKSQVVKYADEQIDLIKNESDAKLANIARAIRALLTKPISQIHIKQDLELIWDLIHKSLWS
jgi:hypothetical protein